MIFNSDKKIAEILAGIIRLILGITPLKFMSQFMIDTFKALNKRPIAFLITFGVNYILGPILCYYFTFGLGMQAMGFTLAYSIQKVLEFIFYILILLILDWKKANEMLEEDIKKYQ